MYKYLGIPDGRCLHMVNFFVPEFANRGDKVILEVRVSIFKTTSSEAQKYGMDKRPDRQTDKIMFRLVAHMSQESSQKNLALFLL